MADRSFEKFDYGLRPNKNVERKMIFHSLRHLEGQFAIHGYRYIGLGSLWFVDFLLAHSELQIGDMVSMEVQASRKQRVEFNRPLKCIDVVMEAARDALPKVLDERRAIVWLDYDGGLAAALDGDLEAALGKLAPGSFILVTVNAEVMQLLKKDADGNTIPPGEVLAELTEDESWAGQTTKLNKRDFPEIVASILFDRLKAAVLTYRSKLNFTPIWNFSYADDAVMVTVGGMIGDGAAEAQLAKANLAGTFEFITGKAQHAIELPVLTRGEKFELDRRLPSGQPLKVADLPFELRPSEVAAYQKYYRFYPVYHELAY